LDILDHASGEEFLEHTKLEMFQDQVFALPKGDLIALRAAQRRRFRLCSAFRDRRPMRRREDQTAYGACVASLHNGDQVEIITRRRRRRRRPGSGFSSPARRRARIRRFIRTSSARSTRFGRAIVQKAFAEGQESRRALEVLRALLGTDETRMRARALR